MASAKSNLLPNGTDVTTALAIVLDLPEVAKVRQSHDRAYPRWPEHINLIFPFVPSDQFESVTKRLTPALAACPPVTLTLDRAGSFKQAQQWTHHIVAEGASLHTLFSKVRTALPEVPVKHPKFQPHLTFGQGAQAPPFVKEVAPVIGRTVQIERLCLLQRTGNEPFKIVGEIPIGEKKKKDEESKENKQ